MRAVLRYAGITLLVATLATAQTPASDPGSPTVFIAGDSTANNLGRQGWGDPFSNYFDSSRIEVRNRARAGRSARTFLNEGLWDKLLSEVKPGDDVVVAGIRALKDSALAQFLGTK